MLQRFRHDFAIFSMFSLRFERPSRVFAERPPLSSFLPFRFSHISFSLLLVSEDAPPAAYAAYAFTPFTVFFEEPPLMPSVSARAARADSARYAERGAKIARPPPRKGLRQQARYAHALRTASSSPRMPAAPHARCRRPAPLSHAITRQSIYYAISFLIRLAPLRHTPMRHCQLSYMRSDARLAPAPERRCRCCPCHERDIYA